MKNFLRAVSKGLGLMGFSFILASAMAGYIANGRDIVVVAIIGFSLLVLSMIVCWAYKVLEGLPRNFTNVVFPDS